MKTIDVMDVPDDLRRAILSCPKGQVKITDNVGVDKGLSGRVFFMQKIDGQWEQDWTEIIGWYDKWV